MNAKLTAPLRFALGQEPVPARFNALCTAAFALISSYFQLTARLPWALSLARCNAGKSSDASSAMIAITTRSSINVKADGPNGAFALRDASIGFMVSLFHGKPGRLAGGW